MLVYIIILSIILICGIVNGIIICMEEASIEARDKGMKKGRQDVEDLIIELFGSERANEIINHTLPMDGQELNIFKTELNKRWGL